MPYRAVVSILLALLVIRCGQRERPPLNLILITLDTTRADHLGCYGSRSGASPNIDKLAARGVRFERVDSVVPLTLPSHATLLTGLRPQRHGLRLEGHGTLRTSIDTLSAVFSRRGFRTGAFVGSAMLDHRFGLGRGFGLYDDAVALDPGGAPAGLDAERPAGAVADSALAWLRETGTRPFFAWIHFYDAHAPYAPPQQYESRFASTPYDGEIAYVDSQVARVVDYVDRAGLREQTVIAIVGDHGEGLGEHGESTHGLLLYESTLRVPLIIAAPSLRARVVREAISTSDVPPTLAALAGVPMNVVRLDGRDLSANLLNGREPSPRDIPSQTQYPEAFGWSRLGSFRRDGKKLISGARDELFNLDRDPHETKDILERDRRTYRELAAALVPFRPEVSRLADGSTIAALTSLRCVPPAATPNDVRRDPRSTTVQQREYEQAIVLLKARNPRGAIAKLEALATQDASNPAFRSALARAYDAAGDHDAALRLDRENVALVPNDGDAWYELASALEAHGDSKESRLATDQALRRDPNRADVHNLRGLEMLRDGDAAGAIEEFRRAIAFDPRSARVYNDLGNALRESGHVDDALDAYRRAVALAPQFEEPRNSSRALLAPKHR